MHCDRKQKDSWLIFTVSVKILSKFLRQARVVKKWGGFERGGTDAKKNKKREMRHKKEKTRKGGRKRKKTSSTQRVTVERRQTEKREKRKTVGAKLRGNCAPGPNFRLGKGQKC